ncbi:hypothetical protein J6S88_05725 [bacterium]|nr:hypothetical protein [bacterium]
MRINAISNFNYAQNNSENPNFKSLVYKKELVPAMVKDLGLKEIAMLKEAAACKISLREMLNPDKIEKSFFSASRKNLVECILLRLGKDADDIRLLYEPFSDISERQVQSFSAPPKGMKAFEHYVLGGKFKLLSYIPEVPKKAMENVDFLYSEGKQENPLTPPLQINFVDGTESAVTFTVSGVATGTDADKAVMDKLSKHGFIPNESCSIPTPDFLQRLVKRVYKIVIDRTEETLRGDVGRQDVLAQVTENLHKDYALTQLKDFIV